LNLLFNLWVVNLSGSLCTENCDPGARLDIKASQWFFGVVGFNLLFLMSEYLTHMPLPTVLIPSYRQYENIKRRRYEDTEFFFCCWDFRGLQGWHHAAMEGCFSAVPWLHSIQYVPGLTAGWLRQWGKVYDCPRKQQQQKAQRLNTVTLAFCFFNFRWHGCLYHWASGFLLVPYSLSGKLHRYDELVLLSPA